MTEQPRKEVNMNLQAAMFVDRPAAPSVIFTSEDNTVQVDVSPVPAVLSVDVLGVPNGKRVYSCVAHADASFLPDELACVPYVEGAISSMLDAEENIYVPVDFRVIKVPQKGADGRVYYTVIIELPNLDAEGGADGQTVN